MILWLYQIDSTIEKLSPFIRISKLAESLFSTLAGFTEILKIKKMVYYLSFIEGKDV